MPAAARARRSSWRWRGSCCWPCGGSPRPGGRRPASPCARRRRRPGRRWGTASALAAVSRAADDGPRWRSPDENYGFDPACETGAAAPELRRRCAWLHHGSGTPGPTEYKFVARSVACEAGSPQTFGRNRPTYPARQHSIWRLQGALDTERPIQVLRPVVQTLVPAMLDTWHHLTLGCPVARELVGDHDARRPALPLQQLAQQTLRGALVAPALHQHIQHHPGLVDRAPEPVPHPGDLDDDLIEVPFVAGTGQPPPDPVGELLAELERPLPDGLVADHDAAGGQHLLDHAQAEREAEVQPDDVADDLDREPMAGIGRLGSRRAHSGRLPAAAPPANPRST